MGVRMRIRISATIVLVLFIAACGGAETETPTGANDGAADAEPINIFTPTDLIAWHIYLADAKDYFADAGLDVSVTPFPSGAEASEAFEPQGGTMLQAGDLPTIRFVSKEGTTALGQITSWSGLQLVASEDIQQPADFRGQKIAVNPGSSTEYWLDLYIEENDLAGDVEVVYLDPGSHPPALLRGDVAGIATFLPQGATVMQQEGYHLLESWPSALMLVVDDEYLDDNREAVIEVLKAIDKAGKEIASDTEASLEAVSGMHGLTDEQYRLALDADLDFEPQFSSFSQELTLDMAEWLKEKDEIPEDFDFCDHWDLSILQEALPDADVDNPC